MASSTDNIYTQTDVKSVYIYENQRWNPVTGYSNRLIQSMMFVIQKCSCMLTAVPHCFSSRGLPTDRYMWSNASGLKECTKNNTKTPSPNWTWVCAVMHVLQIHKEHVTAIDLCLLYGCRSLYVWMLPNILQVSDWTIDYAVQGDTDREGWQYAADFPAYVKLVLVYLIK